MNRKVSFALLLLSLLVPVYLALAQGRGKGREEAAGKSETVGDKVREVLPEGERVFTTQEVTVIRDWFRTNQSSLPPGLAKRETLPPGLERQLREKGTLPPGLQKKIQPFPVALEKQLRQLPTGYRRVVVAGNVILMNPETYLIYDIVRNVIP